MRDTPPPRRGHQRSSSHGSAPFTAPAGARLRGIVDDDAETGSLLPSSESKRAPPTRTLPWWVAAALGLLGVIGLLHLLGRAPHEPSDADAPGEDDVAALAKTTEALEAEAFWAAKATRRQMAAFSSSCGCTRALFAEYAERYRTRARVLVIDGSGFRWEGLGNSGVRWMGLLRFGQATGRATYLRLTQGCEHANKFEAHAPASGRPSDATCHLDLGDYFEGFGGVAWQWAGKNEAEARAALAARGERELVLQYVCDVHNLRHTDQAGGCSRSGVRFPNGTVVSPGEPQGLARWLAALRQPWVRLVIGAATALEASYSKPEALRTASGGPLPMTRCPLRSAADWPSRELVLKCETFAYMQPRPKLIAALLPALSRLEPFDVVVGVHLRTGYADWQFRNPEASFDGGGADGAAVWTVPDHWRRLSRFLDDCRASAAGPCFNWDTPYDHRAPDLAAARECRAEPAGRPRGKTDFELRESDAPPGVLSALLTCGARIAQSLSGGGAGGGGAGGAGGGGPRWGLLVLSDSAALPALASALPALRGRVVTTEGAGDLGHSSFTKSCSVGGGCTYGADPGGAWTRSIVDFYLAGVVDGFAKALFTSFLLSTMRRNLLCCRPGAFVQWNAWYNLSRSHRDRPMLDAEFMQTLVATRHLGDGVAMPGLG